MTIVDTVADRHYGDAAAQARLRLRRAAEPGGAGAPGRRRRHRPVRRAGLQRLHGRRRRPGASRALERAARGLTCKTAVHICYGYGIKANVDWKQTLGERVAPVRAGLPGAREELDRPGLARVLPFARAARADGPARRQGRDGRRDRRRLRRGRDPRGSRRDDRHARCISCRAERLIACTNCGMAPMRREVAEAKLEALARGAALARARPALTAAAHRAAHRRRRARSALSGDGHAVLRRPASPTLCRRGVAELDALRADLGRPAARHATCATAAATARAGTRASSSTAARRRPACRTGRTGSRSNTTRCTAAWSAGSSR